MNVLSGRVEPLDMVQAGYSARWLAFYQVPAHLAELESAALNPVAGRAILERHAIEFFNLRHARPACMCRCDNHPLCQAWRDSVGGYGREINLADDVGREIGRTSPVHPPMPLPAELLDLTRLSQWVAAESLARRRVSEAAMVRYLNGGIAA